MDNEQILALLRQFNTFYINTIEPYITADYQGKPFQLFGIPHLVALGVILLFIVLFILSKKNFREHKKEDIRDTMAAILILNEIGWHLWNYFFNEWTIQTMLPLHVCSILIWLGAWMLIKKSYLLYEFMYFMGIAGALQALLTPDAGIYGFPHYRFFQTFISHGFIVIAALYMTIIEEMRPTWKSFIRVFLVTNIYMVAVYFINGAIGSNYLYVNAKPATASLLDILPEWPTYILYMEAIGLASMFILYLPFLLKDIVNWFKLRNSGKSRLDNLDDMLY
jgi:hypothetical integral membrane protein (TIGR02206 family)